VSSNTQRLTLRRPVRCQTIRHRAAHAQRRHRGVLAARRQRATGYGSRLLASANACAVGLRYASSHPLARRARALLQLPYLIAFVCVVPRNRVCLSDSPSGERIRAHLQLRRWALPRFRLAQGVLHLPGDYAAYLRGRRRQAVRTNVTGARAKGILCTCNVVSGWVPPEHGEGPAAPVERWRATSPGGVLVGEAWLTVDDDCALLHSMVTSVSGARWILHSAIVQSLCARGCRQLLTNSYDAFLMPAGQQHFQRLLGYSVGRVQPASPQAPRPSAARHRVGALVVLAGAAAAGQWALAIVL
jgi:hypothetical protein